MVSSFRQLPLPFPVESAKSRDDFFISPANETAVRYFESWPGWPFFAALLTGEKGSGKTHLLSVFAEKIPRPLFIREDEKLAPYLSEDLTNACLIVENADRRGNEEQDLFHLFNRLKDAGGNLVLTSRLPLSSWNFKLADLTSRLKRASQVKILPPDDALLSALCLKLMSDRQLGIDPAVLSYLVSRAPRSFEGIEALVEKLDTLSLSAGRKITVPRVKEALD